MRGAILALLLLAPSWAAAGGRVPADCRKRARIEGREVSAEAADRLRLLPSTARGPRPGELRLRDGRVLVQLTAGGEGTIYSPTAYAALRAALVEEQRLHKVDEGVPLHPLRGLIDDGDGFAAQVDALAAALARRLEREGLAATEEGVGELAARWRMAGCRVEAPLFRELTAWLGRRAKEKLGAPAAWSTRAADDVAEPIVAGRYQDKKREIAPWELAARLLGEEGAGVAALLDEALTAPPPAPPAPAAVLLAAPSDGPGGVRPSPSTATSATSGAPPTSSAPAADPGLPTR